MSPRPAPSARSVALRVLHRVCDKGAFASVALDAELGRARLSARDAALAAEIVYGTLRALPALDRAIARQLRRPDASLDPLVRAALRSAAYQLLCLTRVPARAVVHETVALVGAERGKAVSGFANAVLRKVASAAEGARAPLGLELPDWLAARLRAVLGAERERAVLRGGSAPPPIGLRVDAGDREELAERIRGARPDAEVRLGAVSPHALLLRRAGDPRALPGHAEGRFAVQEEGSQVVALAVDAQPGERVADLCAGHGGKTGALCRQLGASGRLTAVDVDERKLERARAELARLGCTTPVECHALDLSVGVGGLEPGFDRVLVDAPCSGLGTFHRRPELLLRVEAHDAERMAALQLAIAERAARLVRSGGVLVYAVCSPLPEEGPAVAQRLEAAVPSLSRLVEPISPGFPVPDADGVLRLGPWLSPSEAGSPDLYQVIRWRRRANDSGG